jgi:hypothetical protein
MGVLMHNGVKWTGEGFPPDSPERLAVAGVDEATPVCTCTDWFAIDPQTHQQVAKEGHDPDCPLAPTFQKSVVGGVGDGVACTCDDDWKGEGHQKSCAKRAGVQPCTCKQLRWTEEGHSPECVSQKKVDTETTEEASVPSRRRSR